MRFINVSIQTKLNQINRKKRLNCIKINSSCSEVCVHNANMTTTSGKFMLKKKQEVTIVLVQNRKFGTTSKVFTFICIQKTHERANSKKKCLSKYEPKNQNK